MAPILIVSERVREAIAATGLSLREISRQTGISTSQIARFMRRERGLNTGTLDRLTDYLNLELTKKTGADD